MEKLAGQLVLLYLVALSLVACKKDPVPDDPNPAVKVYAGIVDTSLSFFMLTSPIEISIHWDAQNLYGTGSDSMDFDTDGAYDLVIHLNVLNPDSLHLLSGLPNPFPSLFLTAQNGLEIAFYTQTYPIGLGQTSTAIFADRLDYNERIDTISGWKTGFVKMWGENPGSAGTPPFGDWYYANSVYYLAFKMNGECLGWIEADATDPKNPEFVSFAIQK